MTEIAKPSSRLPETSTLPSMRKPTTPPSENWMWPEALILTV